MELELTYLEMEMYILDNILMANLMDLELIDGEMKAHIQEILKMDLNMGKGNGERMTV